MDILAPPRAWVAGLVALGLAAATGCSTRTLEDEWLVTMEQAAAQPLRVIDFLPQPETPGVPRRMAPYFFFNKPPEDLGALALDMVEVGADQALTFTAEPDDDDLGLSFVPAQDILPKTEAGQMRMDLLDPGAPLVEAAPFDLILPEGRYFNASTALACTRFGGDPSQANQLNLFMEPGVYPLYVLFAQGLDADVTFPTTLDLYIGPAYFRENGQIRIFRHLGFTTPLPGTEIAADGSFVAESEGAFFPLDTPTGVLLLYLERSRVAGRFVTTGDVPELAELTISGVLSTRFLRILAASSDGYAAAVSLLQLDVDLNGNGDPDSANFAVRSVPSLLEPDEYAP